MKTSPRIDEAWQRLRQELTVYLGADADMVFLLVQGRYATVGQTFSELLALSVPPGCDIRTVDLSQSDAQDALGEADGVTLAVGLAGLEEGERRALLGALNRRRGLLDQRKIKLVLWVEPELLPEIYTHAADLLEWRTRLIELPLHPVDLPDATSWLRWPVAIDFAPLFRAAITDGVEVARRRVIGVIEDAVAAAQAVQVIEPAQRKAATLVARALAFGMLALIHDHRHHFAVMRSESASHGEMGGLAVDLTLEIDFFERPDALPALAVLRPLLAEWMRLHGRRDDPHGVYEQPTRARTIAARLGPYYAEALAREYRQRHADYAAIWDAIQSPAAGLDQPARDWRAYHAKLIRLPDEPMFADTFSLRQVYQPLRAWFAGGERHFDEITRQIVPIVPTLYEWLDSEWSDDTIRVISGGPGAGKSSLARMIAADCAAVATGRVGQLAPLTRAYRVILIEMHHLALGANLRAAIHGYGRELCGLRDDPFADVDADPLLLIFDGLDELAVYGTGRKTVVDLVAQIEQLLERLNQTARPVRALVLGRSGVVASLGLRDRHRRQLLHLLPYDIPTMEHTDRRATSTAYEGDLWEQGQRGDWWRAYGEQVGETLAGLPRAVAGRSGDLTTEPLLNYLIALTWITRPGMFTDEGVSLTNVYGNLVLHVYQRILACAATDASDKTAWHEVTVSDFRRFLTTIAVAAWHGDGRTARWSDIEAQAADGSLAKMALLRDGSEAIRRLIATFCVRYHANEPAYVFTHQSFVAYLIAGEIVAFLDDLFEESQRHIANSRRGWSPEQLLAEWARFFGPSAMGPEVFEFVQDALRCRPIRVSGYQGLIGDIINQVLLNDFPTAVLPAGRHFADLLEHSRNAGESLIVLASACNGVTYRQVSLRRPYATSVRTWLGHLLCKRSDRGTVMALQHLDALHLTGAEIRVVEFYRANLMNSSLEGPRLRGLHPTAKSLVGVNFEGVDLEGANLTGADLEGANLERANLKEARLAGANLNGANLFRANLEGARLDGANLDGAYLEGADLRGASYDGNTRWSDGWDPRAAGARDTRFSDGG